MQEHDRVPFSRVHIRHLGIKHRNALAHVGVDGGNSAGVHPCLLAGWSFVSVSGHSADPRTNRLPDSAGAALIFARIIGLLVSM